MEVNVIPDSRETSPIDELTTEQAAASEPAASEPDDFEVDFDTIFKEQEQQRLTASGAR